MITDSPLVCEVLSLEVLEGKFLILYPFSLCISKLQLCIYKCNKCLGWGRGPEEVEDVGEEELINPFQHI